MSKTASAQEPSMEDILASIRRIISDEDAGEGAAAPAEDTAATDAKPSTEAAQGDEEMSGGEPISADDLDALFATDDAGGGEDISADDLEALFANDDAGGGEDVTADDLDAMFANDAPSEPDPAPAPAAKAPAPAPEPTPEPAAAEEDVFELTEADVEEELETIDVVEGMDVVFDGMEEDYGNAAPKVAPAAPVVAAPQPIAADPMATASATADPEDHLLSNQAAESISGAFSNLSNLVVSGQAKTMEDLMREMLRPMLQAWLDQNLPPMVEKMVASEIRRLSGR